MPPSHTSGVPFSRSPVVDVLGVSNVIMVLLAAAICTKEGKALVSRQFVEMSKSRIEGLIATFPKLADPGKQHTFVETDSVRYVYQPLEKLYVLLITTKASNILEDLETLRLFARVIPEYARGSEAPDVVENAFQIIFAFDEIVALGYRESVTLSQIRSFTEMDSHEEKMFNAVRENQMQEARELSKRKARELELARHAAVKQGLPPSSIYNSFSGARGADTFASEPSLESSADDHPAALLLPRENWGSPPAEPPTRRGMQLGSRGGHIKTEMDKLTDMIRSEVPSMISKSVSFDAPMGAAATTSNLHIRLEERLIAQANRDGGVDLLEVGGVLHVRADDEHTSTARIRVDLSRAIADSDRRPPASFQTHPNIDKTTFQKNCWLAIKPGGKAFLVGKEVAVLKWRLQSQAETALPVLINCWPAEIAGGFEVNVEYDLQDTSLSLQNFCITIPLPPSTKPPVVSACDGDYEVDARRSQLRWTRPLVDADNITGSLEFTIRTDHEAKADLFFPVCLDFSSTTSYCGVEVIEAFDVNSKPVKFSTESKQEARFPSLNTFIPGLGAFLAISSTSFSHTLPGSRDPLLFCPVCFLL
ncbi:coatomer subunit delta [Echinococcus multilocularis]|uniref:Coatomer subunit delta n=1 Tax=Echinococcus multilocularis TaxID=6211 RepID=A0A068XZU5_ECHMU|nr:coatomer subunit delta [Echinococcus multilocularis]